MCSLTAFEIYEPGYSHNFDIAAAPARRDWMNKTPQGFANRCLPLLAANAGGWWIIAKKPISAEWSGGISAQSLIVDGPAISHFGSGIITITTEWLFRTDGGWNLLVRGPANYPKDGVCALEGLVETDWNPATFTINWKMTRPGTVKWEAGEPVAMILPQKRGELESVSPTMTAMPDAEMAAFQEWNESRSDFIKQLHSVCPHAVASGWQKDYVRGAKQSRRILNEFAK